MKPQINKHFFLFVLILSFLNISVFAQVFEWGNSVGMGFTGVPNIAVDHLGNSYQSGSFTETVDFDPGPQIQDITSKGLFDIYVSKYGTNGDLTWTITIGGLLSDYVNAMVTDYLGNVYIVGEFADTVDFDPGFEEYKLAVPEGFYGCFIAKYNTNGNLIWANNFIGGPQPPEGAKLEKTEIRSLSVDFAENVYIGGHYYNTVDFDPSAGVFELTSTGEEDAELFAVKFDKNGSFIWGNQLQGSSSPEPDNNERLNYLITDKLGFLYITGTFSEFVDLNPGIGNHNLVSDGLGGNCFITKWDTAGNFIWGRQIGNIDDIGAATILSLAIDGSGAVYLGGLYNGKVDFDPGPSTFELNSGIYGNGCVVKLTSNGNFMWALGQSGYFEDYINSIVMSPNSNSFYIIGDQYSTILTIQGTQSSTESDTSILENLGIEAVYVAKYDTSGKVLCTFNLTPGHNETNSRGGNRLAVDNTENLFIGLSIDDLNVDLNPCSGVINPHGGATIVKYSSAHFSWSNNQICFGDSTYFSTDLFACGGWDWDFDDTISGTANHSTLQNPAHQFTHEGTYNVRLILFGYCKDDTVYYPVTIQYGNFLKEMNISICEGDSIKVSGEWRSSTGVFEDTLFGNLTACDTIVHINLTVVPPPVASISSSHVTIQSTKMVQLMADGGTQYQWISGQGVNCDTCSIINILSNTNPNEYCVIVSNIPGCSDTVCATPNGNHPCTDLFIPNAYSPGNIDAINNEVCLQADALCFQELLFQIFDRKGNKVFESTDVKECWKGLVKNDAVQNQLFVYYLQAILSEGKSIKRMGNITVLN